MTENMKAFIEKTEKNEALKSELEVLNKVYVNSEAISQNKEEIGQKTIDIAAKYGITLTIDDFNTELSEEQLENVAGGGTAICVCSALGQGDGLGHNGQGWCTCVVGGIGADGEKGGCWCSCFLAGGGNGDRLG